MTDGPGGLPVLAAVGSAFCVLLTFLALQLRAGGDPAIGAGEPVARPETVVRRVVVRRVVDRAPDRAGSPPSPAPASAPVAAPVPAPAPAPAPVTTRAS